MTKLTEFDSTNFTTGISNWLGQKRDALAAGAGRGLNGNGAGGGKSLGRHTTRLVANKLYKSWTTYLGSQGLQGTVADFNGFICRFWPQMVPALAKSFPNLLPTANCGTAQQQPPVGQPPQGPPDAPQPQPQAPPQGMTATPQSGQPWALRPRPTIPAAVEGREVSRPLVERTPPGLNIPPVPSIIPKRGRGRKTTPGPVPPAFLAQQRNLAGSGVVNRAQADQVMVALARMLIDSGEATVGPRGTQQPRGTQPRSVAGQAMAGSGGFGTVSAQRVLQTPVTSDTLFRAMQMARVTVPASEALAVHNILAAKPQGMTVSELVNQLHKISPEMMQTLLFAAEYR